MQTTINATTMVPAPVNHWAAFEADYAAERAVATTTHCVQVGMGQLKIGARTDQLQALLGSCVGIAFIWKKGGRCALAHCLLPDAPQAQDELSARYVSQAVPALLRLIGATMLNARSSRLQIGQQNVDAARRHLRKCGLNVQYCRIGGKCGRTLTVDCATNSFIVNEIVTAQPNAAYANA